MSSKPVLLLLASVVLWPVGASAGGIAGLDNLHWGMTQEQVQAVYPNFETWSVQSVNPLTSQPQTETDYGLHEYWAVCNFTLTLDFYDNRLGSVMLTHPETNDDDCRSEIQSKLAARYGATPLINAGSNTYTMAWKVGPTTITYAEHNWSQNSFVSLNYMDWAALMNWMKTVEKRGGNL